MQKLYRLVNEVSEKTRQQKLHTYFLDHESRINQVFCVSCGSTRLDQNSRTELKCYSCGRGVFWNSLRFGIARQISSEKDVIDAVNRLQQSSYDEWHQSIEDSLTTFLQELISDACESGDFDEERLEYLERQWNQSKDSIDRYFTDRRKYDTGLRNSAKDM